MELDFDKYCVVDGSPTTVLPAPRRRSKVTYSKSNAKLKCGNDALSLNKNFTEISFNRYRSASCRDARSRRSNNELPKPRGSVYQSSKEVNMVNRTDAGRKKIELSRESASGFPFAIIDSLCSSDEDNTLVERNRSSVMSTSEQSTSSYCGKNKIDLRSRDSIHYSFSSKSEKRSSNKQERSPAVNLHKSLSAKLSLPHSPARSESDGSKATSLTAMFSPAKNKIDPFVKSRSHKSPLNYHKETGSEKTSGASVLSCNETICKPLIKDLTSPAHLLGLLKLEKKNGVPVFEFSVNSPEDVFIAKTWKVENALTWVYTFHSLHPKRKSNATGWGFKDNNTSRETTMVGQMVISCYLCTELKGAGAFTDSMVTEYVLYDIAQSRRSTSSQDDMSKPPLATDTEQNETSAKIKNKGQFKQFHEPLAAAELHPELEIAAVIMQVPFEKRESLKFKSGDSKMDNNNNNPLPNLLDLCRLEREKESISDNSSRGTMHVVIPAGNHGLPSGESRGPSPLLDRWRLGGGCDCGGWDMGCPLDVFGNRKFRIAEGGPLMDDGHPVELFVQGRKDNDLPSFTMRAVEDGNYAVDFHAQFTCLQAFSISVAILHATEASTAVEHEQSKQMLQSDSMRVFPEEEIKNLIDAISEEEKFKGNNKKEEVLASSFVVNPPFSPIARV